MSCESDHPESVLHMSVLDPRHPEAGRHSQENRFLAFARADGSQTTTRSMNPDATAPPDATEAKL
jgi:hypothetical protein